MPFRAQNIDAAPDPHRIAVGPGTLAIGGDGLELTATLGASLAICLRADRCRLGGLIHVLAASDDGAPAMADILSGIDRLADALGAHGLARPDLTARLCGAARTHFRMRDHGTAIEAACRDHLDGAGIPLLRADLGGIRVRRVAFLTGPGRLRMTHLSERDAPDLPA
ncbi:MAG: chemotaxis protein CheD [Pseudomonadota bacterium]